MPHWGRWVTRMRHSGHGNGLHGCDCSADWRSAGSLMRSNRRPRVLVIGTDRYALEACVRRDIDAVVIVGAANWDNGLIEVPEPLRALRVDDHTSAECILAALYRAG